MSDEEASKEELSIRRSLLVARQRAVDRGIDVMERVLSAQSREDAAAAVSILLDLDLWTADHVLDMQVCDFTVAQAEARTKRILAIDLPSAD